MNISLTTVLLIEDDPADAALIQAALTAAEGSPFRVEWVRDSPMRSNVLRRDRFEVVLLDLSLPDGPGLDAFDQVFLAAPNTLILGPQRTDG